MQGHAGTPRSCDVGIIPISHTSSEPLLISASGGFHERVHKWCFTREQRNLSSTRKILVCVRRWLDKERDEGLDEVLKSELIGY